ncbi:MAG TPA: hypothetical protein PKD59_03525 [Miltoncostaeaceae bacterium]|nr:hypothetical protein [Miltoncostaeaceae bacterium]
MLDRAIAGVAGAALLALAGPNAGAPADAVAAKPRVTFIGDSVAASLRYVPAAERMMRTGLDLRLDLRVCRRLAAPSCSFQGSTPATALEAIRAGGSSLGRTVLIDVGYNDSAASYRDDIPKVMGALKAAGVTSVVWTTLTEKTADYAALNDAIRAAATRSPKRVCVADWAAVSRGRAYFGGDGLHLNTAGATALAKLLRPYALRGGRNGSCHPA